MRLEWLQIIETMHHRLARSAENIAIVSETVAEHSNVSISRRSQELGLSYHTLWSILHLDLHLHPYKVQLMQQLKQADHLKCRGYVDGWHGIFRTKIFFFFLKHISPTEGMLIKSASN